MSRYSQLLLFALLLLCQSSFSQSQKYSTHYNAAMDNLDNGNWEQSEEEFMKALGVLEAENYRDSAIYASCLNDLGFLYQNQGRFDEAENLLLQARDIFQKTIGNNSFNYLVLVNDLGNLYSDMSNYRKAKKYYKEALDYFERQNKRKTENYAGILTNLAGISFEEGDYEKALEEYKEVLDYYEAQGNSPYLSSCLNNMALTYTELGQYEKAQALYLRAIDIDKELFGDFSPDYWYDLMNLADLYSKMGKKEKVLEYCIEALRLNLGLKELSREITPNWVKQLSTTEIQHPTLFLDALSLIDIQLRTKEKAPERYELSKLALNYCNQIRNDFVSEGDKLRILSETADWSLHAIEAILSLPNALEIPLLKEEAFNFSELSKSVLLQTALQADQAYNFGDLPDSLAFKEQDLNAYLSDTKAALLEAGESEEAEALRAELSVLQREANELRELIAEKYPKYHELKYTQKQLKPKSIQEKIPENTAIISYSLDNSAVYMFYLDQNKLEMHQEHFDRKEFNQRLDALRRSLSDYEYLNAEAQQAKAAYLEQADWFYQLLLAPLIKEKELKHLVIVADQELGHLPFEAFLTEAASPETSFKNLPYLIRKYQISYTYSAKLWIETQNNQNQHNGLMYAAAAKYGDLPQNPNQDEENNRLRALLEPLPAAEKEVLNLANIFKGSFLTNMDANEQHFKDQAADYAIIHLAMHGLLNKNKPILSSLAFSENGDSLQDNFLQAYEISQMQLHADLVVLSACETGYGKVEKGEGVMSLARSFMYAGVPSMMVSMWQVNDKSTSIIMQLFYQELAKGKNKAEALQTAKLSYIEMADDVAAQPAFWAAFIQIGNSQAIQIKSKVSSYSWLWYSLAAVLLFLFIFIAIRMRKNTNS
jgi:CHAT domain-containing protein/tetratricopeptide (TPR) repeat protein